MATENSAPLNVFFKEKHIRYIQNLDSDEAKQTIEYWMLEHLRLNGLYWGVVSLAVMKNLEALPVVKVVDFVLSCWDEEKGGFGAFPRHDAHILSTLSALQILLIYDKLDALSTSKRKQITKFIKGLQLPDGSFQGDEFGEIDTRFVYTAIQSLAILEELDKDTIERSVAFIKRCENFDGAFGMVPGAESHAAWVFTCVGVLAITNHLELINTDRFCSWLSERQVLPSGGLNGRPEKLPDVCYSWWVLSSLAILKKDHWIDGKKLENFILSCQDSEDGGISDRPENQTDVFHTCFGICGLSLLGSTTSNFTAIDPIYCLPYEASTKLKKWPNDYEV